MLMHDDRKKYLEEVLGFIKFPLDRTAIYNELNAHIEDRIDDFIDEGLNPEEASIKAIEIMGNAKNVGMELNQMHKPLIGWIWVISETFVKISGFLAIMCMLLCFVDVGSIVFSNPLGYISEQDIVYHVKVNDKVTIDSRNIKVTDLLYEKDGTMYIEFVTYGTMFAVNEGGFGCIGNITDNFDNEYSVGASYSSNMILMQYNYVKIINFPEEADQLNIIYDYYNRHYEFHFDLKEAKENV